jgi:hypothetical protein
MTTLFETKQDSSACAGVIPCLPLPAIGRINRYEVQAAFAAAPALSLHQNWNAKPAPAFRPGEVRVGWRESSLLIFAELAGARTGTRAASGNQPLWELGDVFEVFLQAEGCKRYVELQVAPNNTQMQMRLPDAAAVTEVRLGCRNKYLLPTATFRSWSWVEPVLARWFIYLEMPVTVIAESSQAIPGQQWRCSFGRYQCQGDLMEAVVSSTSAHRQCDFHRIEEWAVLQFCAATN